MRRLLWQSQKEVLSTQSTDGVEIEKCNINVKNGEWSLCDSKWHDCLLLQILRFMQNKRMNVIGKKCVVQFFVLLLKNSK